MATAATLRMQGTTQSYNMLDSEQYKQAKLMMKKFDKEEYDKAQRGGVSTESEDMHDDEAVVIEELTVAEQLEAAMAKDDVNDKLKQALGKKMKPLGKPENEKPKKEAVEEDEEDQKIKGKKKKKSKIKEQEQE